MSPVTNHSNQMAEAPVVEQQQVLPRMEGPMTRRRSSMGLGRASLGQPEVPVSYVICVLSCLWWWSDAFCSVCEEKQSPYLLPFSFP